MVRDLICKISTLKCQNKTTRPLLHILLCSPGLVQYFFTKMNIIQVKCVWTPYSWWRKSSLCSWPEKSVIIFKLRVRFIWSPVGITFRRESASEEGSPKTWLKVKHHFVHRHFCLSHDRWNNEDQQLPRSHAAYVFCFVFIDTPSVRNHILCF